MQKAGFLSHGSPSIGILNDWWSKISHEKCLALVQQQRRFYLLPEYTSAHVSQISLLTFGQSDYEPHRNLCDENSYLSETRAVCYGSTYAGTQAPHKTCVIHNNEIICSDSRCSIRASVVGHSSYELGRTCL